VRLKHWLSSVCAAATLLGVSAGRFDVCTFLVECKADVNAFNRCAPILQSLALFALLADAVE
jgi:hypothetical protein